MYDINSDTFDVEMELSRVILANCLLCPEMIAGIRRLAGQPNTLVVVSSVKKAKKNFYIPVHSIVEYLSQTYNNGQTFDDLEPLKDCFGQLLNDICRDKQFGIRFLGLDGVCCYLGTKLEDLPIFQMPIKTQDGMKYTIDKKKMAKIFEDEEIRFPGGQRKYEVKNHPITKDEQKDIISDISKVSGCPATLIECLQCCGCMSFVDSGDNYANLIWNIPCYLHERHDTIAYKVNASTKIDRRELGYHYAKYCPTCNRAGVQCPYENRYKKVDASFEIDDNKEVVNEARFNEVYLELDKESINNSMASGNSSKIALSQFS